MTLSAQLPRRCWVEIDLAALERNLKLIRASLPAQIKYVAVVKADAYGHGLPQVAARLMHAGADLFGVATIAEAMTVRELSADWPVLLLSPVLPDEDRYLAEFDLAATVSSLEEVRRFDAVAVACVDAAEGSAPNLLMPCGACRQVLAEFAAPETPVVIGRAGTFRLEELLPLAFRMG